MQQPVPSIETDNAVYLAHPFQSADGNSDRETALLDLSTSAHLHQPDLSSGNEDAGAVGFGCRL